METKELTLDLDQLMVKVYTKVALWNNEDGSPDEKKNRLKFVSHEIIETVLSDVLENLNVKTKIITVPGAPPARKQGILNRIFNSTKL